MLVWKEAWVVLAEALRFIRRHWAVLTPWILAVIAANWVGDLSAAAAKFGEGARALQPEPITALGAARAFGWAAGSAVQPGQGINPPWELIPEMTNPFLLVALANVFDIFMAVASAVLINNFLRRATKPLKSTKWLAAAPSAVLVLTGGLVWFRLYGPLGDIFAIAVRQMPPEYSGLIWQVFAWFVFVPFMFTAYLMMLERLDARRAARASSRLLRQNWRSAGPLFAIGLAIFLPITVLSRWAPVTGPALSTGVALAVTALRVGAGFIFATAWLLWADARHGRHT